MTKKERFKQNSFGCCINKCTDFCALFFNKISFNGLAQCLMYQLINFQVSVYLQDVFKAGSVKTFVQDSVQKKAEDAG